ncbi:MAG: hypothetical protein OXG37_01265 [Actinomycetia bacterium]|nr:hypothetical protein [Actinomycetes bacterium]
MGAPDVPGGSFTSVTVMVRATANSRPPVPDVTVISTTYFISTTYWLFPSALAG